MHEIKKDSKIITSLYISYNGITEPITQSQVVPYLAGLSKKGIKFYLLTYEKERLGKTENRKIEDSLKDKFNNELRPEWFCLPYHKRPVVPATFFDVISGFFYALYIILKYKIDIVHARAIVAAMAGWPASKILSKKFIFDTRGIDSEEYVDAGAWRRGGFKHVTVAFFESMITKSSDHVVVLTNRFLRILQDKYHAHNIKFSVIPCAVDTERFKLGQGKDRDLADRLRISGKFVITYIGSLGTWYMFTEMVAFFKVVKNIIENAHFLILTQTDKNYALSLVKDSGISPDFFTIDKASYDSVASYLSLCGAGIFFIKPVFSKLSSSPVKFAEYLACGLPVIMNSGIGDTEEIVRHNRVGVVIEGFDDTAYEKAVLDIMNLAKEPDMRTRCRMVAEKYLSLSNAIHKYHDIYKGLTGR